MIKPKYSFILYFIFCCLTISLGNTDVVVAADGSGDYQSIQKAVDDMKSFPYQPIKIFIKNGTYKEKVRIYPWNTNLQIIGEDRDSTIITFDDNFKKINKGRNSTFHTYTLSIEADDFTMKNVTVVNSAGDIGQAIAVSISGDKCYFLNCKIIGNQDTLYCTGVNSRQYFSGCYIEGTTDFIFGNSIALFDHCIIHSKKSSCITAASTNKNQNYGLVFINCSLTSNPDIYNVYLGRPWRKFAKTVFINCEYGKHLSMEGWKAWSNRENPQSTYYAEYTASNTDKRVEWSFQLTKRDIRNNYSRSKILSNWTPEKLQ